MLWGDEAEREREIKRKTEQWSQSDSGLQEKLGVKRERETYRDI